MGKYCQECGEEMRHEQHRICWNCYEKSTKQPPKIQTYGAKQPKDKNNNKKKDKEGFSIDYTDPLTVGAIAFFVGLCIGILL